MLSHLFRKVIAHFENAFVYMIKKTDKEKKRKGKKRKGEGRREKRKGKKEKGSIYSPFLFIVLLIILL